MFLPKRWLSYIFITEIFKKRNDRNSHFTICRANILALIVVYTETKLIELSYRPRPLWKPSATSFADLDSQEHWYSTANPNLIVPFPSSFYNSHVQHSSKTLYYPQFNGLAELVICTVKEDIREVRPCSLRTRLASTSPLFLKFRC